MHLWGKRLDEVKKWVSIIGSPANLRQLHSQSINIGDATVASIYSARNIGNILTHPWQWRIMSMLFQAFKIKLLPIKKLRKDETISHQDAAVNLVYAFIFAKLDQMNALYQNIFFKNYKRCRTMPHVFFKNYKRYRTMPLYKVTNRACSSLH